MPVVGAPAGAAGCPKAGVAAAGIAIKRNAHSRAFIIPSRFRDARPRR
jgi:hypothetical protein